VAGVISALQVWGRARLPQACLLPGRVMVMRWYSSQRKRGGGQQALTRVSAEALMPRLNDARKEDKEDDVLC